MLPHHSQSSNCAVRRPSSRADSASSTQRLPAVRLRDMRLAPQAPAVHKRRHTPLCPSRTRPEPFRLAPDKRAPAPPLAASCGNSKTCAVADMKRGRAMKAGPVKSFVLSGHTEETGGGLMEESLMQYTSRRARWRPRQRPAGLRKAAPRHERKLSRRPGGGEHHGARGHSQVVRIEQDFTPRPSPSESHEGAVAGRRCGRRVAEPGASPFGTPPEPEPGAKVSRAVSREERGGGRRSGAGSAPEAAPLRQRPRRIQGRVGTRIGFRSCRCHCIHAAGVRRRGAESAASDIAPGAKVSAPLCRVTRHFSRFNLQTISSTSAGNLHKVPSKGCLFCTPCVM